MGGYQTEQPLLGEEGILPAVEVTTAGDAPTFAAFPQKRTQPLPNPSVQPLEDPRSAVLEVGEPAAHRSVDPPDDGEKRGRSSFSVPFQKELRPLLFTPTLIIGLARSGNQFLAA